jgi:hypothetical protein
MPKKPRRQPTKTQTLIARVARLEATVEAYGRILDGVSVVMAEVAAVLDLEGRSKE